MKSNIYIHDMVVAELKMLGAQGLVADNCVCTLDDLMPCGTPFPHDCVAGKDAPCDGTCEDPECCDGHLVPIETEDKR